MLRCIAVDDEPLALDLLEDNIRQIPFLQLEAKCKNAIEATEILRRENIDLIFLDIQMPGLTGLQFIQSLTVKPMIILITAYDQYALEGFNLDVIDYLVKPVSFERFLKACNKAWEFFTLKNHSPKSAGDENGTEPDYFFVNAEYSLVKVVMDDIIMIEGLKDYVKIHLANAKPLIIRISMKSIEEKLSSKKFIRIHKSYIISIARVTSVRKGSIFLGNIEVPLSDNYKETFMAAIGQ
ncbi:MAG: response regulator transcription factor [Bacteroidetes bacterium]|nr:response regulator transcription factor [Bacteroidota bacterium]